jgi:hypothetical protein
MNGLVHGVAYLNQEESRHPGNEHQRDDKDSIEHVLDHRTRGACQRDDGEDDDSELY